MNYLITKPTHGIFLAASPIPDLMIRRIQSQILTLILMILMNRKQGPKTQNTTKYYISFNAPASAVFH
ncbi:MAG: hypothetical protein K9G67_14805 [Bacteroidales bacterium]|nr:hypothetical protein [Bacteroidales bacterium]MCF8344803.1 hypothetical protein [Bacteroidales bacterium]MCF8352020.1 hypothetical protein [Bacteroidales bacterium]MCF8377622.1 hypothetical protein [Bacteroidales bacterium]MCF8402034.1 hypothetical protein [Bacteroidales bacterium]